VSEFRTRDIGFAAFLHYINEDSFIGAINAEGTGAVQFTFSDDSKDDMTCKVLEGMYFSREGLQLRNVREYAVCYKTINTHIGAAKKSPGMMVKL
jgi:hypothetical protein